MKNRLLHSTIIAAALIVTTSSAAYAHVTVKPAEVKVGQYQNFTVSVPTEKDQPTIAIRLLIPEGLESVRPNVKPGWKIELKKTGTDEAAKVSEILWTAGSIPADQRDEFVFSAKTPTTESTLQWKAYQTYQDGSVVAWDLDPTTKDDHGDAGPYSQTKVINDLAAASSQPQAAQPTQVKSTSTSEWVSYLALALGATALAFQLRKTKQ